jgi:ribonuclease-3
VLNCVVAEAVYNRFPALREGELHRLQEQLIREEALAEAAERLGLGEQLQPSVPIVTRSTLADTLEALFGAVFLDGGYAAGRETVLRVLAPQLAQLDPARLQKDPKTRLQELVQARFKTVPAYRVVRADGAAHRRTFEVECSVPELGLAASASGPSRQKAEQEAAARVLGKLET